MKKFPALLILTLSSQPAGAALICPMVFPPPDVYYGQYIEQCMETTVTAAQALACMQIYVAGDPPPPVAAPQMKAFFKRGCALVEAVRRGLISNAGARSQLARNMAEVRYSVAAKAQQIFQRCYRPYCYSSGSAPGCNGN